MFNIDEFITPVTGFVRKWISDIVATVRVCCFPEEKPCINTEVGATAHRAIVDSLEATVQDWNKVESYYTGSNARCMWQGLQSITDYKGRPNRDLPNYASLPDEVNAFYARFDNNDIVPGVRDVLPRGLGDLALRERCEKRSLTPARPQDPTVFQSVFSDHAQDSWQAYSRSLSTSPCPSVIPKELVRLHTTMTTAL
jgi:hypothetical protein